MLKATFLSLGLLLAVTAVPAAASARPQGRHQVSPARDRRGDHHRHRAPAQRWQGHGQWGQQHRRWAPPAAPRRHDRWNEHRRGAPRRGHWR